MMKRRYKNMHRAAAAGMICSGILFAVSGTMYARPWASVTSQLQTDIVDIFLNEYQQKVTDHGMIQVPWEDGAVILPGDRISLIPQIRNAGAECYVRAKVECRGNLANTDLLPIGMGTDWFLAEDGYFYYMKVLGEEQNVELFSGVEVSDNLNPDDAGEQGNLFISVDAIQSRNFIPDYQAENPWGNVAILSNQKDTASQVRILQEAKTDKFQLIWQGNTKQLILNTEDAFSAFQSFLPGDVVKDAIQIQNNDADPVSLYFRSELTDQEHLLAEKVGLKIEMRMPGENRIIYDGNLQAEELSGEVPLGTIPGNSEGEFVYTLSVPSDLDNRWTLSSDQVRWYFSTEPVHPMTADSEEVKTGDMLPVACMTAAAVSFIICIILLPCRERRKR